MENVYPAFGDLKGSLELAEGIEIEVMLGGGEGSKERGLQRSKGGDRGARGKRGADGG